ncbi:MAG: SBBP repeat-containing protein, partial [candidate division Zixibacteria bacterium]|nr:SBBP repeat-containing protein [candidate division Zixibacteria bacterium]
MMTFTLKSIRLAFVVVAAVSFIAASSSQAVPATGTKRPTSYFTENVGQFNEIVKFRGTMGQAAIWLESKGVTYDFSRRVEDESLGKSLESMIPADLPGAGGNYKYERLIVQAHFLEANRDPMFQGVNQIPGKSNYFLGNDPSKWRSNVSNFTEVMLRDVYPGIDVKYYYTNGKLEYDFIVSPGVDPAVIKSEWTGANSVSIDDQGRLIIQTNWGEIIENPPVIYQSDGYTRVDVSGRFVLLAENVVGFEIIGEYHPSLALIIDPSVYYASYLGGSGDDEGWDVVVDDCGFAYMVGVTASTDFDTTTGAYQCTDCGSQDVFIAKFNTKKFGSSSLVYSTYLGGTDFEESRDIDIDDDGATYIIGTTASTDFPDTNAVQSNYGGGPRDVFVTKLNAAGSDLVYSTYLGGTGQDQGYGIAVSSNGEAFVTGYAAPGFPIEGAAADSTIGGGYDVFVTKFNAAGSELLYSTYVGGTGFDFGYAIAVDALGQAYVTGFEHHFQGGVFPVVDGFQDSTNGGIEGIMFKLSDDGDGNNLMYSTYFGGSGRDVPWRIVLDNSDISYITGLTESSDLNIRLGGDSLLGGLRDAFLFKINAAATGDLSLLYSTYIGGDALEEGYGVAAMDDGTIFVTGWTKSTNFPTKDPITSTNQGGKDVFIIRLDPSKTDSTEQIVFSTYFGGTGSDEGYGIHVVDSNGIYVAIETGSSGLHTTTGFDTLVVGEDAFLLRIADFAYTDCRRGDLNIDGVIDQADYDILWAYLFNSGPPPSPCVYAADVNCSG